MGILIYKNEQQAGPFELDLIQHALKTGQISVDDFAWKEGCTDWVPLRTLLPDNADILSAPALDKQAELLARLTSDDQDAATVQRIVKKVTDVLTHGEQIQCIGVQKRPVISISSDAVLLTNTRFMIVRGKSMELEDHLWEEITNVLLSEQMLTATITCTIAGGRTTAINGIPKKQARKIYEFAQSIEAKQSWFEQRGW